MDCEKFESELMEIVLTPGATPSVAAAAHMKSCPPCAEEYVSFQNTFALLDTWKAPEPTAYFDQKLAVGLREEQASPRMGWWERMATRLSLNTGRGFRPAMVGSLSFALLLGLGGALIPFHSAPNAAVIQASATVEELQILDRNDAAFKQMDEMQQDNESSGPQAPETAPQAQPPTS